MPVMSSTQYSSGISMEPVPKLKSAKWVSKAKHDTSFTLYDESQAEQSLPETSLPTSTTDTPILPVSLKRAASQPRLHTSIDGSVSIKTAESPTPSPARAQTDTFVRQPRASGTLQRSQSAFVAPTFGNTRPTGAPGRSRDSRTWAFYCDSEARDGLTKQAEREQTGSAVGAIGLIRSKSKGSLAAINNNNKRASPSIDGKKPSKKAQTSALAKRRANPLVAVKSTHPYVNQIIKDPSLRIANDQSKTDAKKNPMSELDELDGNESDKENWAPGTQTVVSPVRRQMHRPANVPSARVLRDNTRIPPTSTSLGTMLGRSASSTPTLGKGKVTNPVKRNRLDVTKDEKKEKPAKQAPEINDDKAKLMTEEKGKEEAPAEEEDLSCVQGLLSLSQGEWR
ncbi:MAG: hypothetical protein Q9212_007283 [Teloschistes hypoglaucus]